MRVRFGGDWIADSENVVLLHEPGRYPVAYFPKADITANALQPSDHTSQHRSSGRLGGTSSSAGNESRARGLGAHRAPRLCKRATEPSGFAWRATDTFYEEDGRIVGHAADRYHRIDTRLTSRHRGSRSRDQVPVQAAIRGCCRPPRPPQRRLGSLGDATDGAIRRCPVAPDPFRRPHHRRNRTICANDRPLPTGSPKADGPSGRPKRPIRAD